MTVEDTLRVFQAWNDLVWARADWDRVPEFAGPRYTRHEPNGTRVVTAEEYAREIRARNPGPVRFDQVAFAEDDMAFVTWTRDGQQGPVSSVQAYRVAGGRLVESWVSAAVPVAWPSAPPIGEGDPEANKALLRRWYEEMYAGRRFAELAPELCGPVFIRHEAAGTFEVTAEEHAERLQAKYGALPPGPVAPYRALAAGDRVGVIGDDRGRQHGFVQVWRVEDGKFVESWFAGFAQADW
ncbi:nuclear transport factor 2 family protein [Candidatus Amarobacter glycogenicus]|uniref:nuclear transport factor 2 family protein n=1 Tax=Candidatus Amarobacter glycogenicus TaxID=3140699 RepID=UPI003136DD4D|nr:nuclear transport factor 2 family protein [Dehalococcoidia bacterium]